MVWWWCCLRRKTATEGERGDGVPGRARGRDGAGGVVSGVGGDAEWPRLLAGGGDCEVAAAACFNEDGVGVLVHHKSQKK